MSVGACAVEQSSASLVSPAARVGAWPLLGTESGADEFEITCARFSFSHPSVLKPFFDLDIGEEPTAPLVVEVYISQDPVRAGVCQGTGDGPKHSGWERHVAPDSFEGSYACDRVTLFQCQCVYTSLHVCVGGVPGISPSSNHHFTRIKLTSPFPPTAITMPGAKQTSKEVES